MKQNIRDYLTFNKRERNGVFVLISIIVIMIMYLNISDKLSSRSKDDFTKYRREMDSLNTLLGGFSDRHHDENKPDESEESDVAGSKPERFNFDPNNLSHSNWKKLGLTDKQIKTIKNYESKGGKFKRKEDLKKMYCIKNALYLSLEPYIQIEVPDYPREIKNISEQKNPNAPEENKNLVSAVKKNNISLVELNTADSAMLTTIRGIGAFYAKAIIKYRSSLGGFHSKEQLLEIWKFDQEKFIAIEKYISVDPSLIKKININTCEADQLKNPYIKWTAANAIVNYRKHHGPFKTIEDIRNTDLVDEETVRKIAPYLSIE